ncbi:MAG: hypothetical protein PVI30_24500 [Myxococcales bacterium]
MLLAYGCDVRCEVPSCDILEEPCQKRVAELAACLRGGDARDVPLRVVEGDEFVETRLPPEDERQTACTDQWYRGLHLIGLTSYGLRARQAAVTAAQRVAATYSSEQREITVVDWGRPRSDEGDVLLLMHEMTHALQDADGAFAGDSDAAYAHDASLAHSALTEGEAELYEIRAYAYARGFEPDELDWTPGLDALRERSWRWHLGDSDPFVRFRTSFAYSFGEAYAHALYRAGGAEAIRARYEDPPASTREVMQVAAGAGSADVRFPVADELDGEAFPALEDWGMRYVGAMHVGSFALATLLRKDDYRGGAHGSYREEAFDPGRTDGEDGLLAGVATLFASPDGARVALGLRMRFDDSASASEASSRLRWLERRDAWDGWERSIWRQDADVFLVAREPGAQERDAESLDWSSLPREGDAERPEDDFGCALERNEDLPPPPEVELLAAGARHTCALVTGGRVRCWGSAGRGRLGLAGEGDVGDDEVPSAAPDVRLGGAAVHLDAGRSHTCVVLDDGTVRCFGAGGSGRLGFSSDAPGLDVVGDDEHPEEAPALGFAAPAVEVSVGDEHGCVLLEDGRVQCWGLADDGRLGAGAGGSPGEIRLPAEPLALTDVVQLASGAAHTCVLTASGEVLCWGRGFGAQPVGVELRRGAETIAAGGRQSCALIGDGNVWCWDVPGSSGPQVSAVYPEEDASIFDARALDLSAGQRCVIIFDDSLDCDADDGPGWFSRIDEEVAHVAAGDDHVCVLVESGQVHCRGESPQDGYGREPVESVGRIAHGADAAVSVF